MTILDRIKACGYFADFGKHGSMPLGIVNDERLHSNEYNEAMELVAVGKLIADGVAYSDKYLHGRWLTINGNLYKPA